MLVTNVFALIGNTPLIELTSFALPAGVHLFAKLESYNPGGSVKDRLGMELIEDALEKGLIQEGDTIIEPTAGNTGIGLALAAKKYHLQVIVVMPEKFSVEKQILIRALGGTIIHTPTSMGMKGAIEKTKELLGIIPRSYSPQQFFNDANPQAYYKTLGPEIWKDLNGNVDMFIAGAGTGGTFMGVARYLKEQNPAIKTIIVEPENSILLGEPGSHETEGIGMEFLPPYMDTKYFDGIYSVGDIDAFAKVDKLAVQEGLFVGSSSGAVLHACLEEAQKSYEGTNIVTIFPDSSERYVSKNIYRGVT